MDTRVPPSAEMTEGATSSNKGEYSCLGERSTFEPCWSEAHHTLAAAAHRRDNLAVESCHSAWRPDVIVAPVAQLCVTAIAHCVDLAAKKQA
jgi:hypothetical protein